MFVWHTAEEGGLRGSRFNAERVDPAKISAVLSMDMIGRNADDDAANANSADPQSLYTRSDPGPVRDNRGPRTGRGFTGKLAR